jgi:hypothetical protein
MRYNKGRTISAFSREDPALKLLRGSLVFLGEDLGVGPEDGWG